MVSGLLATRAARLPFMTINFLVPRWFKAPGSSVKTISFTRSSMLRGG